MEEGMPYHTPKECFDNNSQILGVRPEDRTELLFWNLSVGLSHLTSAMQSDLHHVRTLLSQALEALQH